MYGSRGVGKRILPNLHSRAYNAYLNIIKAVFTRKPLFFCVLPRSNYLGVEIYYKANKNAMSAKSRQKSFNE